MDDACGAGPEGIGVQAGAGNGFVVHEVKKNFGDLQATDFNALSHHSPHLICSTIGLGTHFYSSCSPSPRILHEDEWKNSGRCLGSVDVSFAAAPEPVFARGKARGAKIGCSK